MYVHLVVTHKTACYWCIGSGCDQEFDKPTPMLKHAWEAHGDEIVEEYWEMQKMLKSKGYFQDIKVIYGEGLAWPKTPDGLNDFQGLDTEEGR